MKLNELSPESRLWLYQSNRALSPTEIQWVDEQLQVFSTEWAAHGRNLKAAGEVLNPYFIALAADLSHENASGCSIDSSVRFVKDLGKELDVDFFNRLNMWVEMPSGEISKVAFRELKQMPQVMVFNPLVDRLGDLESRFRLQSEAFFNLP